MTRKWCSSSPETNFGEQPKGDVPKTPHAGITKKASEPKARGQKGESSFLRPRWRERGTPRTVQEPDTEFPPIEPLRPPVRSPNVLIVLLGREAWLICQG